MVKVPTLIVGTRTLTISEHRTFSELWLTPWLDLVPWPAHRKMITCCSPGRAQVLAFRVLRSVDIVRLGIRIVTNLLGKYGRDPHFSCRLLLCDFGIKAEGLGL